MKTLGVATGYVSTILQTPCLLDLVAAAQRSDPRVPFLVLGEHGVGKDVLARLIHAASARQAYPFIKVNCRMQGLGVDLFGHERGVGPRALQRRPGRFEYANRGTIYLDEIGALPASLIPSLVRVLRTGEVRRAGGDEISHVDVRMLASAVPGAETGGQDALWRALRRLGAVEVSLPPLRERPEEIPIFASFFAELFGSRYRRDVQLCPETLEMFRRHSWPGNVRELEEAVRDYVRRPVLSE